jgi:hypothetical protein
MFWVPRAIHMDKDIAILIRQNLLELQQTHRFAGSGSLRTRKAIARVWQRWFSRMGLISY